MGDLQLLRLMRRHWFTGLMVDYIVILGTVVTAVVNVATAANGHGRWYSAAILVVSVFATFSARRTRMMLDIIDNKIREQETTVS